MPRFLPGLRDNKSWTAVAARPRCNPSRSEQMTLMQAAAQQNKKNRNDLANAERKLAKAQGREDWPAAKKIAKEITRIKARG